MNEVYERRTKSFIALVNDFNMPYQEFAAKANFTEDYVRQIYNGWYPATKTVLSAASRIFGVDIHALLDGEYKPTNTMSAEERWAEISVILKAARVKKGISYGKAADIIDKDRVAIVRIEQPKPFKINIRPTFEKLADLYGLDKRIWYDDDLRAKVMREVA